MNIKPSSVIVNTGEDRIALMLGRAQVRAEMLQARVEALGAELAAFHAEAAAGSAETPTKAKWSGRSRSSAPKQPDRGPA